MPTVTAAQTLEETRTRITEPNGDGLAHLQRAFPWPDRRPDIKPPSQNQGWLGEGTDQLLASVLSNDTRLVVELGAWLGMSTRFIADHAPNATILSVDHWHGNPEHQARDEYRSMLPTLYDTFLALNWRYRDQIVPLRMSTLDGLRTVAEYGLKPDLIYVDAEHSDQAVSAELDLARRLFPKAELVGDDYDWQGVQNAVDRFARDEGLRVERIGARGWKLAEPSLAHLNGTAAKEKSRSSQAVLVPHLHVIEPQCEQALKELEMAGVVVVRRQGASAIDVARNEMLSDALHDGFDSIMFIDADMGFAAADAIRLLDRPEPVVAGIYAKKGPREVTSAFAEGINQIIFGPEAPQLYPLRYAATGFLRVKADVLRLMIEKLKLPLCNTRWGRGVWPFFHSIITRTGENEYHYLAEDWAFSHRLGQIGITPLADTSIRLYHFGPYGYSWEDVGSERERYRTYNLQLG
jgi:hypothetical protein